MGTRKLSNSKGKKDFAYFKKQIIIKQTRNKEILNKCESFFKDLEKNQVGNKKLLLFSEIAGFLIMDFDAPIAAVEEQD